MTFPSMRSRMGKSVWRWMPLNLVCLKPFHWSPRVKTMRPSQFFSRIAYLLLSFMLMSRKDSRKVPLTAQECFITMKTARILHSFGQLPQKGKLRSSRRVLVEGWLSLMFQKDFGMIVLNLTFPCEALKAGKYLGPSINVGLVGKERLQMASVAYFAR